MLSAFVPRFFTTAEVEEENGKRNHESERGEITLTEMDTLAGLVTALPLTSERVQ
jgi:hypothetical protein